MFLVILPRLKETPLQFNSPLPRGVATGSRELGIKMINSDYARQVYPDVYKPFGFVTKITKYDSVIESYGRAVKDNPLYWKMKEQAGSASK